LTPIRVLRFAVSAALPLLLVSASLPWAQAGALESESLKALRRQAEQEERDQHWDRACDLYEEILRQDRNQPQIRARYRHCVRRSFQVRRYHDPSYGKEVLSLKYPQALELYSVVQRGLLSNSLDRRRVGPADMFHKGLEELRWALRDSTFREQFLADVPDEAIQSFLARLSTWAHRGELTRQQAQDQVREVAMAGLQTLNLPATTTVMEFTCGACYAFDEYTVYLTPTQLRELCDSIKGRTVGVGVRLALQDNRLIVAEVMPDSPAAEIMPPLAKDDQILSVDRKTTAGMSPETAMDLLEGEPGTTVELEVYTPAMGTRVVMLSRRPVFVPSVSYHMKAANVGYVQIACFQDSTIKELDTALQSLGKAEMKALILDLRGNSGGLVESAIEAARRFLPSGVIVSTKNEDPRRNKVHEARNPTALTLPLVVLIDGDTASAAEVLAGALKDNRRARLVGLATFGKGCTQRVLKLPPGPGGVPTGAIRVTVARLFSPSGEPYSGRGVVPHVVAARRLMPDSLDDTDNQLAIARVEVQRLLSD
jgi:carboxyl-terminal processing protease